MITLSQNNCFTPRLCAVKGILKTEPIFKATLKDTQLHAKTAAQREEIVLALAPICTFKVTAETWAKEECA